MRVVYKNKNLERWLVALNTVAGVIVAASFVMLMGFTQPLLERKVLYGVQTGAFFCFLIEKIFRFFNAHNKKAYLRAVWFEIPLLALLGVVFVGAGKFAGSYDPAQVRIVSVWVYLVWGETPATWTIVGGTLILSGLVLRYFVLNRRPPAYE